MEEILFTLKPYKYDVIVIDYIGLTKGHDGKEQWKTLGNATRLCKRYAAMTNSIIIGAAQLSEENKLKYSKTMEEHANLAWFWDYGDEAKESKIIEILQRKSRTQNGFTFVLEPDFNYMRFKSISPEREREYHEKSKTKQQKQTEEKDTNIRRKEKTKERPNYFGA
jgi:hypothetical protein